MDLPIRVTRDRVLLYGAALFLIGLWQLIRNTLNDRAMADWSNFWTGGGTVGTRALLDPKLHLAFQKTHAVMTGIWTYPPAFAWLYAPASHLSLLSSYALNVIAMLALAAAAGWLLAEVFEMPGWFGIVAALAWTPVKIAAFGGQNTPLALILIAAAIVAAKRGSPLLLGLAVGLLLYKPTIALSFVTLLLFRREWRALLVVAACGVVWYLLSVAATGGDWPWISQYVAGMREYYAADLAMNHAKTVSLPGLLMRLGLPAGVAAAIGAGIFAAFLPRLMRLGLAGALCVTSLLAVALSPHAWNYEPVIILPALFYAMQTVADPPRTWLVIASYVVAAASIFTIPGLSWNLQLVVVLVWTTVFLDWNPRKRSALPSA